MKATAFLPQLAALLKDHDSSIRLAGADALAQMGPAAAPAAPHLAASLTDGDRNPKVRTKCKTLDALTSSEPLQDRSVLLACLSVAQKVRTDADSMLLRGYLYRTPNGDDLILTPGWEAGRPSTGRLMPV